MKKFVCTVCGYVYEGEAAPAECSQCHAKADKFKEMTGGISASAIERVIQQVEQTRDANVFNQFICVDVLSILEELKQYTVSMSEEEVKDIMTAENRIHNQDYYEYESKIEEYGNGIITPQDKEWFSANDKWELPLLSNNLYAFNCYTDYEEEVLGEWEGVAIRHNGRLYKKRNDSYIISVELDNGEYSNLFAVKFPFIEYPIEGDIRYLGDLGKDRNIHISEDGKDVFSLYISAFNESGGYEVYRASGGEFLTDDCYCVTIDALFETAIEEGWIEK